MKSEEKKQLWESTPEELTQRLRESREKLFNLKLQKKSGEIKNPLEIRNLRRDIARVLTVINSKKKKD